MGIVPLDELYRFLWVPEPNSGLVIFMILAVFLQKSQKNNKNTKKAQKNEARQWGTGSRLAGWAKRGPWGQTKCNQKSVKLSEMASESSKSADILRAQSSRRGASI